MDVKSSNGGKKGDSFFPSVVRIFQAIVMEDTVIDPLGSSTLFHDLDETVTTSGDCSEEAKIPFRFGVNNPSVGGLGTALAEIRWIAFAEDTGAAPLDTRAITITASPIYHLMSGVADRNSTGGIHDAFLIFANTAFGLIECDYRIDVPFVKELVGGVVIAGAV